MPSPVGHMLAGAAVYLTATRKEDRSSVTLGVALLGSIAPDFDFVPGILIGDPAAFHHGASHSLAFALLFGAVVFLVFCLFRPNELAGRMAGLAILAYTSHVILDFVSVSHAGRGISIIWPLSNERFGINLGIFGHFNHGRLKQGIWSVARRDNIPPLTRELVILGSVVLFLLWNDRRNGESSKAQSA